MSECTSLSTAQCLLELRPIDDTASAGAAAMAGAGASAMAGAGAARVGVCAATTAGAATMAGAGAATTAGAARNAGAGAVARAAAAARGEWQIWARRGAYRPPQLPVVEQYLRAEPMEPDGCPVAWWAARRSTYGWLSEVAIDLLLPDPTSTEVERVFSGGRHLVPHLRARLCPELLEALLRLRTSS